MKELLSLAAAAFLLAAPAAGGKAMAADAEAELRQTRQLAQVGDMLAQTALGLMYDLGELFPENPTLAATWYAKAAEQGHGEAQYFLGLAYLEGRGVPQDFTLAHLWLNLAAARATGEARDEIAAARDRVAARMTAGQLAEAQRLAREWQPTPAP